MWDRLLATLLHEHMGKVIGVGLALIISLLVVYLGFWKTVFIVLCVTLGYFIGKNLDEGGSIEHWIHELFRKRDY